MPTPMEIIKACDAGAEAMVAIGLPRPRNYGDVMRAMWAAQDQLTPMQAAQLARRDRLQLELARAAVKCGAQSAHLAVQPYPA